MRYALAVLIAGAVVMCGCAASRPAAPAAAPVTLSDAAAGEALRQAAEEGVRALVASKEFREWRQGAVAQSGDAFAVPEVGLAVAEAQEGALPAAACAAATRQLRESLLDSGLVDVASGNEGKSGLTVRAVLSRRELLLEAWVGGRRLFAFRRATAWR